MTLPVLELFFSSTAQSEEEEIDGDKIIWKDILREGDFAVTPGRGKRVPFRVITDGSSSVSERIISMSDLEAAQNDKAFEHVTIPLSHPDPNDDKDVLNNSGYVHKLRRKVKDGVTYLQAGLGFTEPDVKGKVKRGTIPNVSSGIYFNHERKADGKIFPVALNHVALTKSPWINKLEPFKAILASDDNPDPTVELYQFAEGDDSTETVEVIWNVSDGANWLREKLQESLSPEGPAVVEDGRPQTPVASYYVEDVSPTRKLALVQEYFRGQTSKFLIPFEQKDDAVEPAPNFRWTQVREAMIAASDDYDPFEAAALNKNFEDMSSDKIREKLGIVLSDILGEDHPYEVSEVSVNNKCKIKNTKDQSAFVADFSILENGNRVFISASSEWERVEGPQEEKDGTPIMASDKEPDVSFIQDTPEARVMAARARRKSLLSNSIKN